MASVWWRLKFSCCMHSYWYYLLNFQCVQALQTLRSKHPYHFLDLIWSVEVRKRRCPIMAELSAAMLALGQPHPELCTELPMIHVTDLRVEKVSCRVEFCRSSLSKHTPAGLGLFLDLGYCASIGYCFWSCPGQELWYGLWLLLPY